MPHVALLADVDAFSSVLDMLMMLVVATGVLGAMEHSQRARKLYS